MTSAEIKTLLSRNPDAVRFLRRIVHHAVKGADMPRKIVLGPEEGDKSLHGLLNAILSSRCVLENGKYVAKLSDDMRQAAYWRPLVDAVGYEVKPDAAAVAATLTAQTVKRLKILFPDERETIAALADNGAIRSFVGADANRATQYLKLFEALAVLRRQTCTTLSQLGSDVFNDSKALRSGALLGHLDRILRAACDQPDISASELHAICGIVENPYTSHVVVFAPFCFATSDGRAYDYPKRLFEAGQATVLPWETVRQIAEVRTEGAIRLVTSENAAPFLKRVQAGTPCLYTEGYPNGAVKVLLSHLGNAGAHAVHFGDTDLDGYRIAEQISRCITFDGLYNHARVSTLPHKPLSDSQRARLESFIGRHPDFRFMQELRHTLEHGWVEQESLGWISPEH